MPMSCCRSSHRAVLSDRHLMAITYSGGRTVVVKGRVTGKEYSFSAGVKTVLVDPRDAVPLLRARWFRIEAVLEMPALAG